MSEISSSDVMILATVAVVVMLFIPTVRAFVSTNSGVIGICFAVIAGAYVFVEREIAVRDDRLDRTRSYIERVESGSVHQSRQWFDLHWIKKRDLIDQIDNALNGEDADLGRANQLKAVYMEDFKEENPENKDKIGHLMRLMYFYADLAKCVELGLCEAKTACSIFANDIGKFYVLHSEFIVNWRKVSFERNFDSIKTFLNKTCGVG